MKVAVVQRELGPAILPESFSGLRTAVLVHTLFHVLVTPAPVTAWTGGTRCSCPRCPWRAWKEWNPKLLAVARGVCSAVAWATQAVSAVRCRGAEGCDCNCLCCSQPSPPPDCAVCLVCRGYFWGPPGSALARVALLMPVVGSLFLLGQGRDFLSVSIFLWLYHVLDDLGHRNSLRIS